jgi:serine/threonine protein kinase
MALEIALKRLITAHSASWSKEEKAAVKAAIEQREADGRGLCAEELEPWLLHHEDKPEVVMDLIKLEPPENIEVLGQMSQIGSQKVVYDARWEGGRPLVLKLFKDPDEEKRLQLLERELQPHPFKMNYPHIIETHLFRNNSGDRFLVEKKLPSVLSDKWSSEGVEEASNLLYDISLALQYLQGRDLVHGDIKPDNLGFDEYRYVLLDFGVCRRSEDFDQAATATGSLRTRAPELLIGEGGHGFESDVFALGAVIFNALIGAFPLFEDGEKVPRVSEATDRVQKEAEIKQRVEDHYDRFVLRRLDQISHDGMRQLLIEMLSKDPKGRPDASTVVLTAQRDLVALIRATSQRGSLPIEEQLDQLGAYLPGGEFSEQLPPRRLSSLRSALEGFSAGAHIGSEQAQLLQDLRERAGLPVGE